MDVQTDRQIDKKTKRQIDKQTDRRKDRQQIQVNAHTDRQTVK